MPPRVVSNSVELGCEIKKRRVELGYTIEEAAKKTGVGQKTWSRYEAGEAIRSDKLGKVLRVLKWNAFPPDSADPCVDDPFSKIDPSHEAWSRFLANTFGTRTACMFAIGYDLVSDYVNEELEELRSLPAGTHVGQLSVSWLSYMLPPQFLMKYDYEFVFALKHALNSLKLSAKSGKQLVAHTVLEEIATYLIETEADSYMELFDVEEPYEDECPEGLLGEICGDIDVYTFLYSSYHFVQPGETYHFDNWLKPQFYVGQQ